MSKSLAILTYKTCFVNEADFAYFNIDALHEEIPNILCTFCPRVTHGLYTAYQQVYPQKVLKWK